MYEIGFALATVLVKPNEQYDPAAQVVARHRAELRAERRSWFRRQRRK
jgi:hypothetical protein